MSSLGVDLNALVGRMADRKPERTEANVQSDLHMLLTAAPLQLESSDLHEIVLESPAGQRRRIDVEVGFAVFEVKRDLRTGTVRTDAVAQLAGYVGSRFRETGQRYVGVLTDGAEWHLYHLVESGLQHVSSLTIDPGRPDVETLSVWLEGVLATGHQIVPTPHAIEKRLGATSPAHALDFAELHALYQRHRNDPGVQLKKELWTKLLTTAFGTNFKGEDRLFVEHTLLVAIAEIIGHAVVGIDPADPTVSPATVLSGRLFTDAQIGGVIEADFFDWPADVEGGEGFIRTLARRLTRFAWQHVEHDVMKVLYESVINAEQRHQLGEYYTPDWLAEVIVEETISDPLKQRALDPSCGSGTFLFHAVRRYLRAADEAGYALPQSIEGVTRSVTGLDVHPVAVTLARVTYLLAIGVERLQDPDRPAFSVPIYLGDSMQWGQQNTLLNTDALTVPTDGGQLFGDELRFPQHLLHDASRFDRLVAELADRSASRKLGSPPPSLTALFRVFAVRPEDQSVITQTFQTMCELHDRGRNHIWGYYVRNLARPISLADAENRVDILIGNPPWLSYRFMTADMRTEFKELSTSRGFWAGSGTAAQQDLSALFVARSVELYLRAGGKFAFVMPLATLTRKAYAGFRTGQWSAGSANVAQVNTNVRLAEAWDLHKIKPSFFPVPASVVIGERTAERGSAIPGTSVWTGRLPSRNASLSEARNQLRMASTEQATTFEKSAYDDRFTNGATLFPRMLVMVRSERASPLGSGAGRRAVRSRRGANDKKPWTDLQDLTGAVERQFVRPVHLGASILPFRELAPELAIVPWDGKELLDGNSGTIDMYPGLANWWRQAEGLYLQHRVSEKMTLNGRINYQRTLTNQFPASSHRVVYAKAGMYMAASRIADPNVVIENTLYWAATSSVDEARYLTAVLNSDTLLDLVRPLQARGEHNPRHFDKYPLKVPIPLFDDRNEIHLRLASLSAHAETVAASVELPESSFQTQRRHIRQAILSDGVGTEIDGHVRVLLEN